MDCTGTKGLDFFLAVGSTTCWSSLLLALPDSLESAGNSQMLCLSAYSTSSSLKRFSGKSPSQNRVVDASSC